MMNILKEYWWLSIITIPVVALVLLIFHKLYNNKPVKLTVEVKRLSFVKIMLFVFVLNFGVWGVGTIALHGDAITGKKENNRYYLNRRGHYTEVSRTTFIYSWIHTSFTIASFPVLFAFFIIQNTRKRFNS